jgi:glycosyltransferase involved in cell wall biosynthesis
MKVLFVLHGPFDCNSGVQIFHFANELVELGFEPAVCAPGPEDRVRRVGQPRFEQLGPRALRHRRGEFDLIHAWTPREGVRKLVDDVADGTTPFLVHLEDNEELLLAMTVGLDYEAVERLPMRLQDRVVSDGTVHPTRYPEFVRRAQAVTVITPELARFAPDSVTEPLVPGVDAERFAPGGEEVDRRELRLSDEDFVIVYPGNLHSANERDMLSLYLSVALLRRRGHRVRLVRLGSDYTQGPDPSFKTLRSAELELEARPWHEVPAYLRIADALVQPGAPDDFNRYRLPAKLPEFLVSGKPVALPACNIGDELTDGVNALLLSDGRGTEIADRLEPLVRDRALARRIGDAGRAFAIEHLDWAASARGLADLYNRVRT